MHRLLKLQLKKIYGKNFKIEDQDEKFQTLLTLVDEAYNNYESEEKLLEHILEINAKELEESNTLLFKEQELLKSVENSMDDGIFYKDLDHKYIGCNKKFATFLQHKESEIIGKTDHDFFDSQTVQKAYQINQTILKNKKKLSYKQWIKYQEKDIYLLTNKTPLINNSGKIVGIVGIVKDITHEYELEEELAHKNIMLIQQNKLVSMGEMIANITHQWRQPLNTLGIIIQKMGISYKKELLSEKKIDADISEAMLLIEEMSETIDDFRNFFSPKRFLETFDLHEALLKSYTIIKSQIISNHISFKIEIDDQYLIFGYKNEFFQVMLNILNNAVEAIIADKINSPKIIICVEKINNNIFIKIHNNATAIPKDIIDKIFDPYFTTKTNGTGIGLYMSKIIIEKHMKGKISVENNSFGTTFIIKLPLQK